MSQDTLLSMDIFNIGNNFDLSLGLCLVFFFFGIENHKMWSVMHACGASQRVQLFTCHHINHLRHICGKIISYET